MRDGKMHLMAAEFARATKQNIGRYYDPWRLAFLIGGVYQLYVHWVETDYALPPKEVAALFDTFEI